MRLVKECLRIIWECQARIENENQRHSPLKFWALENPASGYLKWFLGKPAFEYCQSEYGQPFTKKTALWGHFNLPRRPFFEGPMQDGIKSLGGKYSEKTRAIRKISEDGDGGWKAKCPEKFAQAFFEANQ